MTFWDRLWGALAGAARSPAPDLPKTFPPAPAPAVRAVEPRLIAPATPMIRQGKAGYEVHEVVLHTTATPGDWHKGKTAVEMRDEVRRWHMRDNGWRDIGYHWLIAPDGSAAAGRSFTEIGAHVAERNRGTIGIVLVPVRTVDGRRIGAFDDWYTQAQRRALRAKIAAISAMTDLKWVTGHNDYAAKTCPGFYVKEEDWLP